MEALKKIFRNMGIPLTRGDKVLSGIDLAAMRGLEIGPLDKPTLSKHVANVKYVDFAPTNILRNNYQNMPLVAADNIVEVDYVWDQGDLREIIGEVRFEYILASHVVEHAPDMIGWLKQLASVLVENGVISLVVPDKRYTFDRLRKITTIGDLLDAHVSGRRKPSVGQIFDHLSHHIQLDHMAAWRGEIDDSTLKPMHDHGWAYMMARQAYEADTYYDTHCSVFTPTSFLNLIAEVMKLGLLGMEVASFFDTAENEIDFFVSLRKLPENLTVEERLHRQMQSIAAALTKTA